MCALIRNDFETADCASLRENVGAVFASTAEYRLCSQEIVR